MAAVERAVSASALGSSVGAPCFAPVPCVNVDGLEGSTIPGGVHLARYGGGGDYRVAEPLLSVWYPLSPSCAVRPVRPALTLCQLRLTPHRPCVTTLSTHTCTTQVHGRVRALDRRVAGGGGEATHRHR
jgi:hypothetical protein